MTSIWKVDRTTILTFVTCWQVLLFLTKDLLFNFAEGGGSRDQQNWSLNVRVTKLGKS